MRQKRTARPRATGRKPAGSSQVETIETACTCNFPLVARMDRSKPTEPVRFFIRPARVNQPPTIQITRCRNCRRELPQLTPEQFKDTLGLYL